MKGAWAEDLEAWTEPYLCLVGAASAPSDRFVFGDQAGAAPRALWTAGRGEFAPPHGRAWIAEDQVVGVLACLSAAQLASSRLQAALVLKRAGLLGPNARLAADSLVQVQTADFYLSRLAVAPAWRRRGLGQFLLQCCERAAVAAACRRVILEAADEAGVQAFYRSAGYATMGEGRAADPQTGTVLHYLHLAKELD